MRRALRDAPGVRIETVRGQGYRLLAEVTEVADDRLAAPSVPTTAPERSAAKPQRMHFCAAPDGARLAYALLGEGPPLVKAANWLNHLELDWKGPIWRHWLELLSGGRCFVRYDARGNGLSSWDPPSITFEDFVADLGAVFEAAQVGCAPVLGISQGAAVAVAYAARHPERVSALTWADLSVTGASVDENHGKDLWLSRQHLTTWAGYYAAHNHRCAPLLSPAFADLSGLPPLLLLVGEREILRDDTLRVAEAARRVGTEVEVLVGRGMQHDWPLTLPWLDESRHAWATMSRFIEDKSRTRAPSQSVTAPHAAASEGQPAARA